MQIKEVENVVKLIQSFDPPGIGARNLKECLIIQLNNIEKKNNSITSMIKYSIYFCVIIIILTISKSYLVIKITQK